jgi:phosphatidylglycerophosphate synthase
MVQVERKESSTRTREIEEFTNLYFIHPLGARLVPILARVGVSPNAVSFTGMACGVLAGVCYNRYPDPRFALAGLLLMIGWHVLDGVDGQLARLTNRQSEFGKVIDGIADNVTFVAVYLGLGLALDDVHGFWIWGLLALAGVAHSAQAATYELQRQEYDFWGWNKRSAEFKSVDTLRRENVPRSFLQRIVFALGISYVKLQQRVSGVDLQHRSRIARALESLPDRAPYLRQRYRETFAGQVKAWSIMSSNYRTLAIFACVASGMPLVYFFGELVGLSLLTVLFVRRQRLKSREFAELLDQQAA